MKKKAVLRESKLILDYSIKIPNFTLSDYLQGQRKEIKPRELWHLTNIIILKK